MQVDGAAPVRRECEHGLGVAGRIGVEVGAAADHARAHVHGVPERGETVRARDAREEPGDGHGGQFGESAQGTARGQDPLQGGEALCAADPHMGAQRGRPVAELEQRRLGGATSDVLGPVRRRAALGAGERRVGVGVGFGGGRQQKVTAQVQARSPGGEAARRPDRLDVPSGDAHVDEASVGQARPAEQERARVTGVLGHRAAPGGHARSRRVRRA